MRVRRTLLGLLALLLISALALPAAAQDAFYKGRTITLYVGFGPGGTYHLYAQMLARHMGRHIQGNPGIVVQSMPGAGSITLTNYMFSVAPKDGTALATVAQAIAVEEALKSSGIAYRAGQFNWIGRASNSVELIMSWHTSKSRTIADTRERDTPTAGTGPASPSEGMPRLLNATYGSRFRIVSGYPSSAVALAAMERGEVDSAQTSWSTIKATKQDWLKGNQINILFQGTLERIPELPNVPAIVELGRTLEDRALLAFYISSAEVGRSFLAPPGVPPERLTQLRRAFDSTMKDPELLADLEKAKTDLAPMTGEKLQQLVADTLKAPPEVVARMRAILDVGK